MCAKCGITAGRDSHVSENPRPEIMIPVPTRPGHTILIGSMQSLVDLVILQSTFRQTLSVFVLL